jgi:hypothetical protein
MKILEFKTISPFFELCRDGKKPFDIRLFDYHDKRFRSLSQRWVENIKFINPVTGESYTRKLKDWRYIQDTDHKFIKPYWIIMYLGKVVPEGSAH